ncbi:probable LRR receptor-like serine/threonine-protein kinase At3g47570 [Hordeum vulgare subsp. vulgare]|uniref:non-specific serine/threonine protein kinase n=1 Tax=Hordeum vulgare subsp. vulgare TaxID=112509 RepID=A0A8I6WN20_HORVV|nr:probable LRR receptor-like serine/threonine-protein kinase At3g47570 [Hordeum vulgare subsp. vulgare]
MAPAGTLRSLPPHGVLILFTHLLIFMSSNTVAKSSINGSGIDMQALISFKRSIHYDPLGVLESWNRSIGFCRWTGVTCGTTLPPRVVSLNLSAASLSGQFSPWVANLTSIQLVDLSYNGFSGAIPEELGTLQHLRYLELRTNSLVGIIPRSLGTCRSLREVDLSSNILEGTIPDFHRLPALQTLILSRNDLIGTIPRSLGNSRSLKNIDLSSNFLVGPIPEFDKMSALQILDLSSNDLSGSIPSSLGNVSSLIEIRLDTNSLSGAIPETLSLVQNLSVLNLANNSLSGHLSAKLCNISSLIYLDLAQNKLTGSIPPSIGNTSPNLERLSMSGNEFKGLIPSSLANASYLRRIDLGHNSLVGPVPSLGSLSDLRVLNLESNFLQAEGWEFLVSLTNCAQLQTLDMSGNALNGNIPISVGNLSRSLVRLSLGNNQIVGTIPIEIFNLRNLQMLAMGQNNFLSGVIPSIIGNLDQLVVLDLSGNKFSGPIPFAIGNLSRLNQLYLDGNDLSGNIPATLGNCKQLDMLKLSSNNLQGPIPSELINSTTLIRLDLSTNYLTGSIPPQIGALLQLFQLDISFNRLSGQVPLSLGQCVQLYSLRFRSNMLNGSIPQSFSNLKSINQIDLSQNSLVGQIPEFFANMGYLQQLDLSMNYFEGPIPTGGIFQNHSAVNLEGNDELCASATTTLYQFPVCTTTSAVGSKKNALLLVKVIPPIAIALLSLICFVITLLKRRQAQAAPCYKETMKKVSYGDIIRATNWLSPVNKISSSRTGSIYIGRFEFDTDLVAIKLFHLQENGARDSFVTECEVLRNTRHRNLVKAVTVCSTVDLENNEFKAIVFDFMANGSLDMWVHPKLHNNSPKRVLSLGQRLRIAMDVALALDYMHNQLTPPLIHCDLKPGNVLLDYDMTARVGDFGSARFLSSVPGSPEDLVGVEGTIGYVAPEYCMGYKVSTGCDVYGFGVLLLEMLTGRRPTDAMFTDGLSLHKLVSSAFPGRLGEVLDPHLSHEQQHACGRVFMRRYMVHLVEVALLCSMESPKDRPGMGEVCARILSIKEAFFEFC